MESMSDDSITFPLLPFDIQNQIINFLDPMSTSMFFRACKMHYTIYQATDLLSTPMDHYFYNNKKRLSTLIFCAQKNKTQLFQHIISTNETDEQKNERKEVLNFFGYRKENTISHNTIENNIRAYQGLSLYEKSKKIDYKNRWLIKAIDRRCMPGIIIMLKNGADSNCVGDNNQSALCIASEYNLLPAMSKLIKRGARLNHQSSSKNTPLHYAVISKRIEAVQLLLQHSANTSLTSNEGTPLDIAQTYGYTKISKLLQLL
jgi:hypothetical protein